MARFLHIADIHLGFDRYDSPERSVDFFKALNDVIERYAVQTQVDFVLIAGDLFEHRNIQPNVLNQAKAVLRKLKAADIPALVIEGNHDNRPYGTRTSWLRYLAEDDLLLLLEPQAEDGGCFTYEPWDAEAKVGGYIDLPCGVRVLGSCWWGAAAPQTIPALAAAIEVLPPGPKHTVLMFHHGLEGQIARYNGALRYQELLPLKAAGVDYLALGHIHKNYELEGWIFNPGSLEANSVEESTFERGAYSVEISQSGIRAKLERQYYQRTIHRLRFEATGQETVPELEEKILDYVRGQEIDPKTRPIVELKIEGQVGFDRLDLDTRGLQRDLKQLTNALVFLLRYDAAAVGYATPLSDDSSRIQMEREVFTDELAANAHYKKQATELAQALIGLKEMVLEGRREAEVYEFVRSRLQSSNEE
ncbi:exonuclease SbcCD subunit D [Leptolyngbya sp. FACHB-261]|uniref:metallophosphoesterase family protein n=1 Tax=Leptolyngbya sp. FACHB-261 TaxID=2692806 RepID=UPI001683099B|nr:exonuclease SbcCD subunit D [Leptolyngbya sp. FACHB-261]MBD2103844.1 exonuclease SbcCD subunit D [Leptolyngbya sp. FACHB-261]